MNIKKRIKGFWYAMNQNKIDYETKTLCGVSLKTTKGTIRSTPDQDDAWFFLLAKHHECIFDIGANVGYNALLAFIQNPHRHYILVDPNPKALAQANYNLLQNNLGFGAHYFPAFVSDKNDEKLKFYTIGAGAAGSMHKDHAKSASAVNSYQTVTTTTLDYIYKYYGLRPNLVKIDVEGAETMVVSGATKLAADCGCSFLIEMHHVAEIPMKEGANLMIDWCRNNNYVPYYLKTGSELKSADTIAHRGKCHLLLLPEKSDYPEYLKNIPPYHPLPNSVI